MRRLLLALALIVSAVNQENENRGHCGKLTSNRRRALSALAEGTPNRFSRICASEKLSRNQLIQGRDIKLQANTCRKRSIAGSRSRNRRGLRPCPADSTSDDCTECKQTNKISLESHKLHVSRISSHFLGANMAGHFTTQLRNLQKQRMGSART